MKKECSCKWIAVWRRVYRAAVWLLMCFAMATVAALLMNLWMALLTFGAVPIDLANKRINEGLCALKLTTQCKPECKTVSCRIEDGKKGDSYVE